LEPKLLSIKTLGELKQSNYKPKTIKEELRDNLIVKLRKGESVFEGIWGYEDTVIPDLEKAILSMHHINLLGLRGQAKTRIARLMVNLLDEYIPVIEGSELNDDPLNPISWYAKDLIASKGEDAPVHWLHRSERYNEKLATPDVSVSDLIGDVDPIKAAAMKLPYSDERVIHFGLIPRSHRCIFVINELPDLQARIQVSLFNILQEGDVQIRGFKLRLPLDIQFVFTANPEDYTNRGSIVTPLKDRIDSQIITHYPKSIETSRKITEQEAIVKIGQEKIRVNDLLKNLIEQVAVAARESEYVDAKSGVSARLTISAYENLLSSAERRLLINFEKETYARISDLYGTIPAINGKIELVYEGEVEGPAYVALSLLGKAIRAEFLNYFPDPEKVKKSKTAKNPYEQLSSWFAGGNEAELSNDLTDKEYKERLKSIDGLEGLVMQFHPSLKGEELLFMMEFALHGLAEFSLISKHAINAGLKFSDLLGNLFDPDKFLDNEDEQSY
jgi:magnesium chelatase subunit I